MAPEECRGTLAERLQEAAQAFENLVWAAVEAQPASGPGHALVDYFDTAATDALDEARSALDQARRFQSGAASRGEVIAAARSLAQCEAHLGRVVESLVTGPASLGRLASLDRLAAERRGDWVTWVHGVRDALEHCQQAVGASAAAMAPCWTSLLAQIGPAMSARSSQGGRPGGPARKERQSEASRPQGNGVSRRANGESAR